MVAGAVVLPEKYEIEGLADSKLTKKKEKFSIQLLGQSIRNRHWNCKRSKNR